MAELIVNQQSTETLSTTDNTNQTNRVKDYRIVSEAFLVKVSQCIKIANTIRTDYGIDILDTNGNFEITDKIIDRLDTLSSTYFQNTNRNNNIDTSSNLFEQDNELQKSTSFYNYFNPTKLKNDDNKMMIKEQFPTEIHCIPIKLPTIVEMQLRNNRLLKNAINNYRRHERYSNLSKNTKISSIKTIDDDEEDILMIDAEPLCPTESNDTLNSSSILHPKSKASLITLMKQLHQQCKTKTTKKKNALIAKIDAILEYIINEEITYEYIQNELKTNNQSKQLRKTKKNKSQIIQILPYKNTYNQYYYPDQFLSIEQTMIDKIVYSVKSMAAALTNTKDVEDVLNGIITLADQSTSPLVNKIADELIHTIQKKQGYTTNLERIHVRMALDLILADNRLNGITMICRSESLIISCMLRKILMCIQTRTLCSYADVITGINDSDSNQIRLRTFHRMCLSSDEFIEILGEMYQIYYDTIESMKYYLEANDVIDIHTNLIHSSTSEQIDDMMKYILREDAIRLLLKLIFYRKRDSYDEMNNEQRKFQLILPPKLNELYQPIKKLNAFLSANEVMSAIRKPYLSQLTQRSKTKAITVNDLRSITSQIWLTSENFETLISENTITSEVLCQFYTDFHEIEDIDERLNKINKKIEDHLHIHSCTTRVALKMLAEYSNGTNLTPFLDEFNQSPRLISIIDIFDDLISSGLISITELIVYSKQDIIIKKSSLLKHFERISFIHKRDVDLLAEMTLVIREDHLIEYLTQRTVMMKHAYIDCVLNNDEHRDFITKNLIGSTKRLSSLSIHKFLRHFNLDPICGKIFYWMGLTDENIVKTLIETKTFVNEYTLDGIYNNFLTRLHDTLESGIYYVAAENLKHQDLCKLGCFLTYEQASILIDFADPEYEQKLSSLITILDVIPQEYLKSNNNQINLSLVLPKQEVIECKVLLHSFHQRILYRQTRFERIQNLQKLLLSSLFDQFIESISDLGAEYFTHIELDYLEETKLIDIGVLALLLTLPSYNPLHKHQGFDEKISDISYNYLHILDPIIEKYSIFLTTIIIRIISNQERFSTVNEILLSNPQVYLSTKEVLQICAYEQILTYDDILQICRESFPSDTSEQSQHKQIDSNRNSLTQNIDQVNRTSETNISLSSIPDCYTRNMRMYTHDPILQQKLEQTVILAIFDYILLFNHRNIINGQLQQLLSTFKPLLIYKAQLLIEKEMIIVKLLLKTRKQQSPLTIENLNKYLESYPIPCRLDILNELRRLKFISQSITNTYTMKQCYDLKSSTPETQSIFLFYMMIKLIRTEGYIDENHLRDILNQYQNDTNIQKLNIIYKHILRNGFLTIEQIIHSAKDFFLQDYFNEDLLSEYKTVIPEQILTDILHRKELRNTQFEFALSQNIRRRQVVPMNILTDQIKSTKIAKEKVQRKVDHVLSKMDENIPSNSKMSSRFTTLLKPHQSIESDQSINKNTPNNPSPDLRSLRHNYIQAKIPRNQLHFLAEQGGWEEDTYLQFKRELDIIDSDNSLNLIQHITRNISLLLQENGSIGEKPLMKHFRQHHILFLADFQLLMNRYGMVALEDLVDLLVVSRLARADEIEVYAKGIFCLNVNKFIEISKSQEDLLVKKPDVQNNLEKRLCVTSSDLSQLLNHVLKLDRLKRIIDIMPTIKNHIRLHPINTFNALKALKLEFDFNHYDMKFLRDLKVLSDTQYKLYLVSRTSETGPMVSEIFDEEQEQEDRREFKFRSSADEDFDFDSLNEVFETKESQLAISEQRKQAYLKQIKKRKDQMDLYKSNVHTDEDHLQLSLNLDEFHKQEGKKDRPRVIEQFFPEASTVESQLLIPSLPDDQNRLFIELDFAKEQNIEDDRYHRRDIKHQTKKHRDTVEGELIESDTKIEEDKQIITSIDDKKQQSISKLPADDESSLQEEEKDRSIEDLSTKGAESKSEEESVQQQFDEVQDIQPTVGKRLSQIKKSSLSSDIIQTGDDKIKIGSPTIKDGIVDEKDKQLTEDKLPKSSVKISTSDDIAESSSFVDKGLASLVDSSHPKSTSFLLPNATEDLNTTLTESLKQTSDTEQLSFKRNLKLVRLNVDQWLQQTLQHNEQISANTINNYDQSFIENESLIHQLTTYFHNELNLFHTNFISPTLISHLNRPKLTNIFHQRINHIENILQEKKNHQDIIKQVHKQIIDIDQTINEIKIDPNKEEILQNLNHKFNKYKQDFDQIKRREYFEIQPVLGTRLELAIRTLDADLQLLEKILDGETPTNMNPITSLITKKTSRQFGPSVESQTYKDITFIRANLSSITADIKTFQTIDNEKKIRQDLLSIDTAERLQAIKQEYSEQKINEEQIQHLKMNIDKFIESDQQFIDTLTEIHNSLDLQSNQIQKNLSNITTALYHSNHPNFPLNVKLKFLPVDTSGTVLEEPLYIIDEQNIPISDELNLIRLPHESDRFHISTDKDELTIVDTNQIPLSEPITFKHLTSELLKFEFTDDHQRAVQLIKISSHQPIDKIITLNVKPVSYHQSSISQSLFAVDNNNHPLSKPIQLLDHTHPSLNISDLNLATFLYDEKTNEKILLTPEQYQITKQQAEFTSRQFLTYIINKDKIPISEPIQISDTAIQIRHSIENTVSNKLNLFNKNRHELFKNEYELLNGYIQDRLDKLRIEEKIIEQIVPILDKDYNIISTDQIEYKREQSNMDKLLNSMKIIVQLDEKLTEDRKSKSVESSDIQKLENNLIHQLTETSTQLNDRSINQQIQNLTNRSQNTQQLLNELRPIILSGIKNHAKVIQKNCETLLINIHKKSNQFKQPEQIRFEYIQYLNQRFNEQIEHENNIENLYNNIERMQYDHYQKIADSSETIELEDLDNEIKDKYDLPKIPIPDFLETKNEKLIHKFNFILRFLGNELKLNEQYQTDLLNEINRFLIESIDHENSCIHQINYLHNQIQINHHEKLLKSIEKFKILLNKFQLTNQNNFQYNFLISKLDSLYQIFTNTYQIHLPSQTNIESIRLTLNDLRKTIQKETQQFHITKHDLLRKLDVLKKKEELKQRTKINRITEESQLSSLNAYIQQSKTEPINIHHEFYTMKIQQITKDLIPTNLSIMNSLNKTLDHLKSYIQILDQQKIENENNLKSIAEQISITREYSMVDGLVREQIEDLTKQQNQFIRHQEMITKMQIILNETLNHLQSQLSPNPEQNKTLDRFKQLKQNAMDTIIQSAEYQRLSKRISPHLLLLNKITSGQELIPSLIPSSVKRFQLEVETHIQQELPSQIFLLQDQSATTFQKDFIQQSLSTDPIDPKTQMLQTEIDYLQKQHAESISIGDFTQKLAAEQAMSVKFQAIERLQNSLQITQTQTQDPSTIDNRQSLEHISSTNSEKSLTPNQVDEQVRGLLKDHVKLLQKHIQNEKSKLSETQTDAEEMSSTHSVEDLRQLKNDLKQFHQENNRQKQIDTQLQILDKIQESDVQSIDQKTLRNLRKHLLEEQQQGLVIRASDEQLHHDSHIQILPISPHVLELPLTTVVEEKTSKNVLEQTMLPVTGELLKQTDSLERMNMSLVTTDAREVYQELKKIRYSIEMAAENPQITSADLLPEVPKPMKRGVTIEHDEEHITSGNINTIYLPNESRWQSSSIVAMDSSLFSVNQVHDSAAVTPSKTSDHEELPPSLSIVGNTQKYSITQTKAKDRQIGKSTKRSIFQSQREYGEVYVRHRLVDVNAPISNQDEEKLRDKIQRKTRLVRYEKTGKGHTVIHRRVDLPTRLFIIPQQANYEENLEPSPPLVHVEDTTNFTFDENSTVPFKSKRSSTLIPSVDSEYKTDHWSQKSDFILPFHSSTILSSVKEEPEEIETTNGIAFSLSNQDSLAKNRLINIKDKIIESIPMSNDEKPLEKLSASQEMPSSSSTMITSHTLQPTEEGQQQKIDDISSHQATTITSSPSSFPKDLPPISNISKIKTPIKSQKSKKLKTTKKKHEPTTTNELTEDIQLIKTTNDDSLSTQGFDIEQEIQQPIPIIPEGKVIYHKVGGKLKRKKKKSKKKKSAKTKPTNVSSDRIKKKRNQIETTPQAEPLVLVPRKAVPFISATKDKQINVEEDSPIKKKKKKRKTSKKSKRKSTRSRSRSTTKSATRKKKKKKQEKTDIVPIEPKLIKNKDAIAMRLLNVTRFTGPPISAIAFDQTRHKYDAIIEIPNNMIKKSRLSPLKPMIKNFELDTNFHKQNSTFHNIDAYDLDKELFDFNNDTKDIDQPAMFTEYIPELFQKQAVEKQIRRISLTAIKTDEHLTKRLAPRIRRLYNGWQPSDTACAHTDEFRPLNKHLMSDISYYFDDDFIDVSGLFQNQKNSDKAQPVVKQPTQRFRDDYIVKEFFNCWKDYTTENARIAELRRKRVTIDFREFWFQDAFSNPFYSYFEQSPDYIKKQDTHHQMAYRLHKRLVRTGREQPKDTMNHKDRSSFFPVLFNLPNNHLDRQGSLTRRRQLINYENKTHLIPLSDIITDHDDVLPLIRERIHFLHQNKIHTNIRRDELAIKQRLLNTSLLEQGTIKDLDGLINDYYTSLEGQEIKTIPRSKSNIVKLPMLKHSSNRIETIR